MKTPRSKVGKEEELLKETIEFLTGIKIEELLNDEEKRVTFFEVNMAIELAWQRYWQTHDPKDLRRAVRARNLLNEMGKRAADRESLYLKPSELESFLSSEKPTRHDAGRKGGETTMQR